MPEKTYSINDEEVSIIKNGKEFKEPEVVLLNRENLNHLIVSIFKDKDIMITTNDLITLLHVYGLKDPKMLVNQVVSDGYFTIFEGGEESYIELTRKGKDVWSVLKGTL